MLYKPGTLLLVLLLSPGADAAAVKGIFNLALPVAPPVGPVR
jgi:hypothetical protein